MDVASRITELRNQKNISVNKLANLSGLSQSFIRQVELGEKNITVKSLTHIVDALDLRLEDFFSTTVLSASDLTLLSSLKKLTPQQKDALTTFINLL